MWTYCCHRRHAARPHYVLHTPFQQWVPRRVGMMDKCTDDRSSPFRQPIKHPGLCVAAHTLQVRKGCLSGQGLGLTVNGSMESLLLLRKQRDSGGVYDIYPCKCPSCFVSASYVCSDHVESAMSYCLLMRIYYSHDHASTACLPVFFALLCFSMRHHWLLHFCISLHALVRLKANSSKQTKWIM